MGRATTFKGPKGGNLQTVLTYKGFFDIAEVMRFVRSWGEDRDFKFYETVYKNKPDMQGREVEVKSFMEKKINNYVKWTLNTFYHTWDIHKKEVVEKGKRKKKEFGRMKITFFAAIEYDWDNNWDKSPVFAKLHDFFLNKVVNWEKDMVWEDALYYELYKLKEAVAEYLDLYYSG
ncbi:hypothetical protein GOV05_01630 [Candidatus Woesearchaeota archaeon]|nr:hypothetical protein [Candidatus Woesearchaeota archaeon]